MSTVPFSSLSLPDPGPPPTPQQVVGRFDQFLGSVAAGIPISDAQKKHYITRADIETMCRLPGEAGVMNRKRWEQARLAGSKSKWTLFEIDAVLDGVERGCKLKIAVEAAKPGAAAAPFMAVINSDPDLKERYLKAKEVGAMMAIEDNIEIADDDANDTIPGPKGTDVPNMAAVNRSRLKLEERWRQARALAKPVYGDKKEQTVHVNIAYAERLERAYQRLKGNGRVIDARKEPAIEASFTPVVRKEPAEADTSWMDTAPTETIWREES